MKRRKIIYNDPKSWMNTISWNVKKPVSFSASYSKDGTVTGSFSSGWMSNNREPTISISASNHLDSLRNGDYWTNIKYTVSANHGILQGVVSGDAKDFKYIVVPKMYQADKLGYNESASVGVIIHGKETVLNEFGGTFNAFGALIDFLFNKNWNNVREVSLNI